MKSALVIFAVSLITLVAGVFLGIFLSGYLPKADIPNPGQNLASDEKLFTGQSAIIRGKIQKVEGSTITVTNSSNQTGEVFASKGVVIIPLSSSGTPTTPNSNISQLELNKEVNISLHKIDGKYLVDSIQYVPTTPSPSIPPAPNLPKPNASITR